MIDKLISPSILNVEKNNRKDVINQLINLGIKWIHYDVMDNQFVPNKAIEIDEIISFQKNCHKHLSDVHLMVENPFEYANYLSEFVTCLTIHFESFKDKKQIVEFVDKFSNQNWIGLAIKPSTKFDEFKDILYLFDLVLIMSVEPGFGGQTFIETTYDKLRQIKQFIDEEKLPTIIQVDGGINNTNSKKIFDLGSSLNVVGSYLIKDISKETLDKLK